MKRVLRYELDIASRNTIKVPTGYEVLTVAKSRKSESMIDLWVMVDEDHPKRELHIRMFGTGQPMLEDPGLWIGTVSTNDGMFIWHVFESI